MTHGAEAAEGGGWRGTGAVSPDSWDSFGEEGAEESGVAISSISE